MKEGWTYKKLGEVATIIGGSTPKSNIEEYWGGTHYWVTPADLDGNKYQGATPRTITDLAVQKTNLQLLPIGTVLLSSRAPIGKVAITTAPMYCNQGFKNIVCSNLLINEFVYWYLFGKVDYLNSLGRGATFKEISKRATEQILIPVPPMAEQERIVAELDLLQGIIEKKKEQLKAYDQLAQSIFYTMFGDPIDNPKGWETKKLGELVSLITDGDWIESKDQSDNGIRLIQTGNIGSGFFIAKDDKPHFISETTFHSLGCTEVFGGDCLISRLPSPVGRACLIPKTDYRMITAVDCTIVRFRNIILPQFFINYSLSSGYQAEIDRKTTGTTRKRISRKNLEIIPVPLPPLSLQQEFAQKVEAIERQKALVQQSIEETQTMFDYTMDKYFG